MSTNVSQVSIALQNNQIEVIKSSMLGSILSNLLLVMGICFYLGGIFNMRDARGNGTEQVFASGTAQTACSLLCPPRHWSSLPLLRLKKDDHLHCNSSNIE
jgi:calcium/proton exchanger cax